MADTLDQYVADMRTAVLETSKQLDRAVLTLSSAALGLSLAFLKDARTPINARCLLFASWILFFLAILATLFSFFASMAACRRFEYLATDLKAGQLSEGVSVAGKVATFRSNWETATILSTVLSAVLFAVAGVLTIAFVIWNLP